MKLLQLAIKSAWNRKVSLMLAVFSIAISLMLLLGVDKIRKETRNGFINTISQTDLIVGARGGPTHLLLYSVFHIGNATNNVSYKTYQAIAAGDQVEWAVPISLGDSHQGYRVMGTTADYYRHYQYGNQRALVFAAGKPFEAVYDAVLGAEVAAALGYQLGDKLVLSHGTVSTKFSAHDDKPFTVSGILKRTGTPLDRTIQVSLQGIEAIHIDWQSGARSGLRLSADQAIKMNLEPKTITALMLGLHNRIHTFRLQRAINEYADEPLLAIVPGATLATLWQSIGSFEKILLGITGLVLITGLIGMMTTLLSTVNERRREMAILRAIGVHAYQVVLLFTLEAVLIVLAACVLGVMGLYLAQWLLQPLISAKFGIDLSLSAPDSQQWLILAATVILGALFSLLPGLLSYQRALQDGLLVKL